MNPLRGPTFHLTQSFAIPTHTLPSPHPPPSHTSIPEWGEGAKLVYRHYATLFFILVVDDQESELGILDLIQGAAVTTIACQLSPFILHRAVCCRCQDPLHRRCLAIH